MGLIVGLESPTPSITDFRRPKTLVRVMESSGELKWAVVFRNANQIELRGEPIRLG
jgi:hypothetical protein